MPDSKNTSDKRTVEKSTINFHDDVLPSLWYIKQPIVHIVCLAMGQQ